MDNDRLDWLSWLKLRPSSPKIPAHRHECRRILIVLLPLILLLCCWGYTTPPLGDDATPQSPFYPFVIVRPDLGSPSELLPRLDLFPLWAIFERAHTRCCNAAALCSLCIVSSLHRIPYQITHGSRALLMAPRSAQDCRRRKWRGFFSTCLICLF